MSSIPSAINPTARHFGLPFTPPVPGSDMTADMLNVFVDSATFTADATVV
jgi:hypothetical protein